MIDMGKRPSRMVEGMGAAEPWAKGAFRNEGDVRAWFRKAFGELAFWTEPSLGSSVGMPDAMTPIDAIATFFELKEDEILGEGWPTLSKPEFFWRPVGSLRGAQFGKLWRLTSANVDAFVMIGELGSDRLWITPGRLACVAFMEDADCAVEQVESKEWLVDYVRTLRIERLSRERGSSI